MMFEFLEVGQYKVILGKSFDAKPKKKAPKYFNVKNKESTDLRAYGNEAKLEKKKDRYQVEMKHINSQNMIYDAEVSTEEEFNCILIYNEEKKTITIERQSAEISLTRKKVKTPQPNGHLTHSPLPANSYTPITIHTPSIINTAVSESVQEPVVPVSPVQDDDEFDLSKDLDEILDSDIEEDEEEEEEEESQPPPQQQEQPEESIDTEEDDSESDQFEEIIAPTPIPPVSNVPSPMALPMSSPLPPSPNIPLTLALPGTPTVTAVPASSSSPSAVKKRKFKMASAPIRHPGIVSPLASTSVNTANKRPKTEPGYSSSSGSEESSSGSESGSTESSSGESESESGSSSDDDDFESLAQDISMSLSKGGPSAPASPQHMDPNMQSPSNYKRTPYDITPANTPTPSTRPNNASTSSSNGVSAPMSLRALFKEDDEEEGLSSSSESEDDD
ncbi:hypothetical protein BDF21DRAFT_456439 [Thamnidium elegans]|nr:hypothetical protein BDF21DRAFT_456439 [Thamnidium elegans]